jgi:hypothetical protein
MKTAFMILATMFITIASFSQTIKENIAKQSTDPKTAEHAAKADVYIAGNKKKISDSGSVSKFNTRSMPAKKKKARRSR